MKKSYFKQYLFVGIIIIIGIFLGKLLYPIIEKL